VKPMTPTERFDLANAAVVLRIVSHPTRLAILRALMDRPVHVGQLVSLTDQSQPNVSQHLAVLREAGLVDRRIDGPKRLYYAVKVAFLRDLLRCIEAWAEGQR